ncbi:MAG: helix-turn-helix domain-containing protein [Clostridia bacterium]|nr:helix-turn-helix domain-containing protein [Clostridia bacterium]
MELGLTVELGMLLDTYGDLLTEKMQEILKMYVFENMSYQEIGNYFGISKPAVLDAIRKAQNKLIKIEQKIQMLALKKELNALIDSDKVGKKELTKILNNF